MDDIKPRRIKIRDEDEDMQKNEGFYDEEEKKVEKEESHENGNEDTPRSDTITPSRWVQKNHHDSQIIGDTDSGVKTRIKLLYDEEQELPSIV